MPRVIMDRVENIGDVDAVNVGPTFGMQYWRWQCKLKIGQCATVTKPRIYVDLSNHFTLLTDLIYGIRQSSVGVIDSFYVMFGMIVTTKGFICSSEMALMCPHIF